MSCGRSPPTSTPGRWWRGGCARRSLPCSYPPAPRWRSPIRICSPGGRRQPPCVPPFAAPEWSSCPRARWPRTLTPTAAWARRLRIVNPGVELARFAAGHVPAAPPEVLVLGALVSWKRPDLALEAVALARRRLPDLRLRVVGAPLAGEDEVLRDLRTRAGRPDLDGHVELPGPAVRPELDLARAACLLHCAPREPFGLVVAEALAAGCPAVVPDAGGPAEIVDDACGAALSAGGRGRRRPGDRGAGLRSRSGRGDGVCRSRAGARPSGPGARAGRVSRGAGGPRARRRPAGHDRPRHS